MSTTTERNKAVIRRFFDAWNSTCAIPLISIVIGRASSASGSRTPPRRPLGAKPLLCRRALRHRPCQAYPGGTDRRRPKPDSSRCNGRAPGTSFNCSMTAEDVNDAERLCRDPAIRWVVGDWAVTGSAASASQMGRFETKWLSRPENLAALADLTGQWIEGAPAATAKEDRARHGFEPLVDPVNLVV
jgi:hypothetical protein